MSLGIVFLAARFSSKWAALHGTGRLLIASLLAFVFPIVLSLMYLLALRYKPSESGINLHYWYLPLFLHLLVAV